jgi:hypothetical protein
VVKGQKGFSYLFALFALVLIGLSMMGANKQWVTMMKREREAELLYRGNQYRRAIFSYVESVPGARKYPQQVEDLLKDPRNSKRHLRAAYMDPITGGPFHALPCRDGAKGIKGVYSPSDAETLKRDNFPAEYEQFRSATMYREWMFQYEPNTPGAPGAQPAAPGAPGSSPTPRGPGGAAPPPLPAGQVRPPISC